MKLSERIAQLQAELAEHGDIDVLHYDTEADYIEGFDKPYIVHKINGSYHEAGGREAAQAYLKREQYPIDKLWEELPQISRDGWGSKERLARMLDETRQRQQDIVDQWDTAPKFLVI